MKSDASAPEKKAPTFTPRSAAGIGLAQGPRVVTQVLPEKLQQIFRSAGDRDEAFASVFQLVVGIIPAWGALYLQRGEDGRLQPGTQFWKPGYTPTDAQQRKLTGWANAACRSGGLEMHAVPGGERLTAACLPVYPPDGPPDAVCFLLARQEDFEYPLTVARYVAVFLGIWSYRDAATEREQEAAHAAALIDLISRMHAYSQRTPAAYRLVNELQKYLACGQVALGWRDRKNHTWRLEALSGQARPNVRSQTVQAWEAVIQETCATKSPQSYRRDHQKREITGSASRLARLVDADVVRSLPLHDPHDDLVGAWVFAGDTSLEDTGVQNFLSAAGPVVAACLGFLSRNQRGPLYRLSRALWKRRGNWKLHLGLGAAVAFVLIMMLPVHYRIRCGVNLEPVSRRYVAAPFDAVLEGTLVEPGDLVRREQLLARLDGREIRLELASTFAEFERADRERRVALASQDAAAAQQAELKGQRLQLQIEQFQHRMENLEIRSPIDGVVIHGDLQKAVGVPVRTGQTLLEIGPLHKMLAEIRVPDEDIAYVSEGARVRIRLDAYPSRTFEGRVARIFPRAELRDHENVFVAEIELPNPDGLLRPGMSGRAKVLGPRRPLAWCLFHKPWFYVRDRLGGSL